MNEEISQIVNGEKIQTQHMHSIPRKYVYAAFTEPWAASQYRVSPSHFMKINVPL